MCEQKLKETLCIIYSLIKENVHLYSSVLLKESPERIYGKIQENLFTLKYQPFLLAKAMEIFQNENSSQKSSCLPKDLFIQTVSKSTVFPRIASALE